MAHYKFELEKDGSDGKKKKVVLERQRFRVEPIPLVLCLVLSLIIWIVIYNLNDESVTQVYTVPLTVTGKDSLLANDLSLYNSSEDIQVKVEIKGTNRDIRKCKAEDFRVVADVSKIKEAGNQAVTLEVSMPSGINSLTCVSTDPPSINVFADAYVEKEIPFDITMGYMQADSSYEIGTPVSNVKTFRVAGPGTVIREIERASYTISPGVVTGSVRLTGIVPQFYSSTGEAVPVGNNVVYTPFDENKTAIEIADISITLDVATQKKVPIRLVYDETKYSAMILTGVSSVTLHGDPKLVEAITEYTVELNNKEGVVKIRLTGKADVDDKLPLGVSMAEDGEYIQVSIKALTD